MLNRLSGQDLVNQSIVQQNSSIDRLGVKNNPYANIDKNLLIDETNISNEAFNLYQRDLDIQKFSSLVLSDPDDMSHNTLVAENVFSVSDDDFDAQLIEGLFSNRTFLRDLFG